MTFVNLGSNKRAYHVEKLKRLFGHLSLCHEFLQENDDYSDRTGLDTCVARKLWGERVSGYFEGRYREVNFVNRIKNITQLN